MSVQTWWVADASVFDIAATHDLGAAPDSVAGSFSLPFGFYATVTVFATATWPDGKVTTNASWAIPVADCATPAPPPSTVPDPPPTTTPTTIDDGGNGNGHGNGNGTATGGPRRPSSSARPFLLQHPDRPRPRVARLRRRRGWLGASAARASTA